MRYLKKQRLLALTVAVVLIASLLAGCAGRSAYGDKAALSPQGDQGTRMFTDLAGVTVELPKKIEKVVHLWPASTAMHVFLGTPEKITGTLAVVQKNWGWMTAACPRLLEVKGFESGAATTEQLLAMAPDVVITSNKVAAETYRQAGIPCVCMLAGEDLNSLKEMITKMGELLGEKEAKRAAEYITYLDGVTAKVQKAVAVIPEKERAVIYYNSAMKGESPLFTCGDGSIVETWIETAGCKNAVKGKIEGMDKEASLEIIMASKPDYIVVGGTTQEAAYKVITTDPTWKNLSAVKNGKIIRNPQGVMKWDKYGVEIALQLLWFTEQIYPKALDTDIKNEVKDFYKKYYNFELSDAAYNSLLAGAGKPM